jgi:hypothetical protein
MHSATFGLLGQAAGRVKSASKGGASRTSSRSGSIKKALFTAGVIAATAAASSAEGLTAELARLTKVEQKRLAKLALSQELEANAELAQQLRDTADGEKDAAEEEAAIEDSQDNAPEDEEEDTEKDKKEASSFRPRKDGSRGGRSSLRPEPTPEEPEDSGDSTPPASDSEPDQDEPADPAEDMARQKAKFAAEVAAFRREQARARRPQPIQYTATPLVVQQYTGKGGTAECTEYFFMQERQLTQLQITKFEAMELQASYAWSNDVYTWYSNEVNRAKETGKPKFYITSWDALKKAFRHHFESRHDGDDAVAEYINGESMRLHKGENTDAYMIRIAKFHARIPADRIGLSEFIERAVEAVKAAHPAVWQRVSKELREYRSEHEGKPMALHTLRNAMADAQRDVGQLHLLTSAPRSATEATDKTSSEVVQLKARIAKLTAAAAAAPAETHKVHAVAVAAEAVTSEKKRYHYDREQIGKMMDRNMCFRCGATDHVRAACPAAAAVDLRPRLN